jgi:hypothetical protein
MVILPENVGATVEAGGVLVILKVFPEAKTTGLPKLILRSKRRTIIDFLVNMFCSVYICMKKDPRIPSILCILMLLTEKNKKKYFTLSRNFSKDIFSVNQPKTRAISRSMRFIAEE